MWTGWYLPNDWYAGEEQMSYFKGDRTVNANRHAIQEGPSYCVRLLVFDYDYSDD